MAVITGAGGAVDGVACVRFWKVVTDAEVAEGVCSSSDSIPVRIAGNDDWRGVFTAYGKEPTHLPGSTFRFIGATRDGKGVDSQANGAIVDKVVMEWDTARAKLLSYKCFFSSAGQELLSGNYSASDSTIPNPPTPVGLGFSLDGVAVADVEKMELTLECDNPPYVTSSTSGHTYRNQGNYDASFKALVLLDNPADLPSKNTLKELKINTKSDGSEYWLMKWAIITEASPELPIEGPDGRSDYMKGQIAGKFSGFKEGIEGTITTPSGTVFWP